MGGKGSNPLLQTNKPRWEAPRPTDGENTMDLQTATHDELMAYAKDVKGMRVASNISTEKLREKLTGAPVKEIDEQDDLARKITIVIQEDEKDDNDVFVGVNGRHFLIQRGTEAEVPAFVVEILKNAKKTIYTTKVDRQTGQTSLISREVLSYPFQIVA